MRNTLLFVLIVPLLFSACQKNENVNMHVTEMCNEIFISKNAKATKRLYGVCNGEVLKESIGEKITVSFEYVPDCERAFQSGPCVVVSDPEQFVRITEVN